MEELEDRRLLSATHEHDGSFSSDMIYADSEEEFFSGSIPVSLPDLSPSPEGQHSVSAASEEYQVSEAESLSLTVTNTKNSGAGSLRQAIADIASGGTITFDSSLNGQTITLDGTELTISKSITIDASALSNGITINANQKSRVFNITDKSSSTFIDVTMKNLTITGGKASGSGGGIYCYENLNLMNCTISGNTASFYGGGICGDSGTLSLTNCTISGNTTSSNGGGIYANYGTQILTNCMITGNTAFSGGGFVNYKAMTTLTNCTISGNTASNNGGIYTTSSTLKLYNTIVSGNFAKKINTDLSGAITSGSSNNIIGYDPGFVVAPVFDSDGILTNADSVDYHLKSSSQAIDKGNNTFLNASVTNDLSDNTRIVKAWQTTATIDIGAYEYQSTFTKTIETASTLVTTLDDIVDDTDGKISLREAIEYATEGSVITFSSTLSGNTTTLTNGSLIISKGIKIDASSLAGGLTIQGDGKNSVFILSGGTAEKPLELRNLIITGGNSNNGGGIYAASGTQILTNCTISGNSASGSYSCGGGIYAKYGTQTLINCTITGNTAPTGGGIYIGYYYGTLTLYNTIVAGNTASSSNDIYKSSASSTLQGSNNLSSFTAWNGTSSNNYTYDSTKPLFVDSANGNYRLAYNSQAIDKGNNSYLPAGTTTDINGKMRIYNGTVDIGACEYSVLNITLSGWSGIYNGEYHGLTLSGTTTGDVITYSTDGINYSSTALTYKNVGNYTIHIKVARSGYYDWTGTSTVSISQKQLSINGTKVADKTYDGTTNAAITCGTITGICTGDSVTVSASGAFNSKDAGSRNVSITYTLSGTSASNYFAPTTETKSATISQKQLSISGTKVADKTYDGTTNAAITCGPLSDICSGDSVTVSASGAFPSSTAGTYSVRITYTLGGTSAANYSAPGDSFVSATIIAPCDLKTENTASLSTYAVNSKDSFTISGVTVTNTGNAASGKYYLTYYASLDTTIDSSDIELGNFEMNSLSGGTTITDSRTFSASHLDPLDKYHIAWKITLSDDPDLTNNCGVTSDLLFTIYDSSIASCSLVLNKTSVCAGNTGNTLAMSVAVNNTVGIAPQLITLELFYNEEELQFVDGGTTHFNLTLPCKSSHDNSSGKGIVIYSWEPGNTTLWNNSSFADFVKDLQFTFKENVESTSIQGRLIIGNTYIIANPITIINQEDLSLDVDGDGQFNTIDLTLMKRYLVMFQGDDLIDGINTSSSLRKTADDIYNYMDNNRKTVFDVDGNNVFNQADYSLIKRYYMNCEIEDIATGIDITHGSRTTAQSIYQWIDSHMPVKNVSNSENVVLSNNALPVEMASSIAVPSCSESLQTDISEKYTVGESQTADAWCDMQITTKSGQDGAFTLNMNVTTGENLILSYTDIILTITYDPSRIKFKNAGTSDYITESPIINETKGVISFSWSIIQKADWSNKDLNNFISGLGFTFRPDVTTASIGFNMELLARTSEKIVDIVKRPNTFTNQTVYYVQEDCWVNIKTALPDHVNIKELWKFDNGDFEEKDSSFWLDTRSLNFGLGTHLLQYKTQDSNGIESDPVSVSLNVVKRDPSINVNKMTFLNDHLVKLDLDAICYGGRNITQWIVNWGDSIVPETFDVASSSLSIIYYYQADDNYNITLKVIENQENENGITYSLGNHSVPKESDPENTIYTIQSATLTDMHPNEKTAATGMIHEIENLSVAESESCLTTAITCISPVKKDDIMRILPLLLQQTDGENLSQEPLLAQQEDDFNNHSYDELSLALSLAVEQKEVKKSSIFEDDSSWDIDFDFLDAPKIPHGQGELEPVFADLFTDNPWDVL